VIAASARGNTHDVSFHVGAGVERGMTFKMATRRSRGAIGTVGRREGRKERRRKLKKKPMIPLSFLHIRERRRG